MRTTLSPLIIVFIFGVPSSTVAFDDSSNGFNLACESAERCFRAAVTVEPSLPAQERARIKIERLRGVQERHPGSVWAKRAGLLMGLLLAEREPAEAVRFLRIALRDLPLLEDYLRLWIGESLLKTGDALQAAALFDSITEAVPDTLLTSHAAFRSGQAWSQAGQCGKAVDPLVRAVSINPQVQTTPAALLMLADCQIRENRPAEASTTLRQLWVQYPNSPEAHEASARLASGVNGEAWHPTPEEVYGRALAFFSLALHTEAVQEFQRFLSMAPQHAWCEEAKFRLGMALVRLKRYDQAKEVYQGLIAGSSSGAGEAAVWLARIYLRQGEGERLLALPTSFPKLTLSGEQRATILMLGGVWLEDQGQYDQAITKYRQVAQSKDALGQHLEALWRIGWVYYRRGQYQAALETFQKTVSGKEDPQWSPQALYWMARVQEHLNDSQADASYLRLCRQHPFTYYCQLAQSMGKRSVPISVSNGSLPSLRQWQSAEGKPDLGRHLHFLKAYELKILGMDQDAAKELAALTEQFARDRAALVELSALLSDVGAYHQALRLTRLYFRDGLERGGEPVPAVLWSAAYPMVYLPMIRAHAGVSVDPFLAAAIIREESQYDIQALSRVGAIGLMQVMPTTAQAMAKKIGASDVMREDLFDQETNIRFGVKYLEQLLQQFSGNIIHAVAAYNAGPQVVSSWIQKYGEKEPDEFVELIPYRETRQYVKRVLRSYREYSRLAGLNCDLRSLDKVC